MKYEYVPNIISSKDLDYLSDMFEWNYGAFKRTNNALKNVDDVEICEILGVNPYELYGAGSLLIVCDKGNQLVGMLKQENIYAAVIGKTTADKAKVLWNQEEKRYLDRPRIDMGCL